MLEENQELLILTPKVTPRLRFVFRFVFQSILNIPFRLTTQTESFKDYNGPKFIYGNQSLPGELFIASRNLLFETGIKDQELIPALWQGTNVFYSTNKFSAMPFDPFAASFFLISRYEEYLPAIRDRHDRFEAGESFSWQIEILDKPVIDIWAMEIRRILENRFSSIKFPERKYKYLSTIDIDNAFAFKEKGMMRTGGALAKTLITGNLKEFVYRLKVLTRLENDPFDTYAHQWHLQQKYDLDTHYFILFAEYGLNDKNIPVYNQNFQKLIKSIADTSPVGIHPSYGSNLNKKKLEQEIKRLSKVIHRDITSSRQHFLKLKMPDTYKNLIDLNISDDYTMGYATQIGFRAGTCTPFYFFDLDLEAETKLKIHPFQVMDATLCLYLQLSPEEAIKKVKPIIESIKAVNGTFVTLWHNESLSDSGHWRGWRDVYEEIILMAVPERVS